jgi:hypothetical protein
MTEKEFFNSLISELDLLHYDTHSGKIHSSLGDKLTPSKLKTVFSFRHISSASSFKPSINTTEEANKYLIQGILENINKVDSRLEREEKRAQERAERQRRRRQEIALDSLGLIGKDSDKIDMSREPYEKLVPIILPYSKTGKEIAFYCPETRQVHVDMNCRVVAGMKGVDIKDMYASCIAAKVVFNPYSLQHLSYGELNELLINSYNPPYWREVEFTGTPSIPPFFDKLLNHLFPTEGHKEYVLAWICRAVLGRNNTILTLVGAKGIGKTLLASTVGNLVGKKYYAVVGNSILTEKFNSPMKNNRLLFLDEVVAKNQEELSKLKSYVNKYIPIEEKGVDTETKENFNSIILSCNVDDNIGLQADDRRYSVPDLTDINLMAIMTEDEINEFAQDIEEEKSTTLQELGNWILENGEEYMDKYPDYSPLKSKSFYHIVRSNMALWQIFTEDYLIDSPSQRIAKKDLAKAYERQNREGDSSKIKYPKNSVTIENFLKSHSYLGKYRLARLEKGNPLLNEASNELYFVIDDSLYREVMLPKMSLPEQVAVEKRPIIYINKTDEALDL